MKKIKFTKMVASGNDFVVVNDKLLPSPSSVARKICDRKFGIGADGMLLLSSSKKADIRMRIFNADGSEAEMCGNGARCSALFVRRQTQASKRHILIETKAGLIESWIEKDRVRIKLTDPLDLMLDIPLKLTRALKVNFINTGVPHAVIFVEGLDKLDVFELGRQIRFHQAFAPKGTNVNFVEVLSQDTIRVRTYERGVEGETLACGTGVTASALITSFKFFLPKINLIKVITESGETLKVSFKRINNSFKDVWLEGKVQIVFNGEIHTP